MTLYKEVNDAVSLEKQKGETHAVFAKRAALRINKLTDVEWKKLSEPLQVWTNDVLKALDAKEELPVLGGFPEDETADPETGEVTEPEAPGAEAEGRGQEGEREAEAGEGKEAQAPAAKRAGKPRKPAAGAKSASKKAAPAKAPAKAAKPAAKAAAKPKGAKAKKAAGKGRPSGIPEDGRIKILAKTNPHRPGSFRDKNFKLLKPGMTVAQAVAAGCPSQQLWSLKTRGVISIA